jgi:hypothetical protein
MKFGISITTLLQLAAIGCALACTGCEPPSAAVVPVSGTVTLDGLPLAGATLTFQPITEKGAAAQSGIGSYGKTDDQGRFTLRLIQPDEPGALVGKHTVTLTTAVAADPMSDILKLKQPERIPPRQRKQEFTVPMKGTDQANFGLTSR